VVCPVQVGGGVRTLEDVASVLEIGAGRAILGTSAALDPGFVARAVEEFAERVLVAVDVRGGHAMVKGWREEGPPVEEVIPMLNDAGTPRYLVTAIARDGTLEGPDLRLYWHVLGLTDRPSSRAAASARPTTSGRSAMRAAKRPSLGRRSTRRRSSCRRSPGGSARIRGGSQPLLDVDAWS
jgi:uncharacterized protein related to proFAR isomerase